MGYLSSDDEHVFEPHQIFKLCAVILFGNILYYYLQNGPWEALKLSADLYVFLSAAKTIWDGQSYLLYDTDYYYDIAHAVGPYNNPPFLAIVLSPLTLLPFKMVSIIWIGLNFLILCTSVTIIWYESKLRNIWVFITLFAVCGFFGPLIGDTHWANVNSIVWLTLLLAWWFFKHNRFFLCGVALAVGVIIKLIPVMLIGYFLFRRQYRVCLAACVTLAVLLTFSIIVLGGFAEHLAWFDMMGHYNSGAGKGGTPMDQSIGGFFKHLASQGFIGDALVHPLAYLINFSILILTFLMCRFKPVEPDDRTFDLEYGLVASLPLLVTSMIVIAPHFTILLTTYLLLLYYLIVRKKEIPFLIYPILGLSYALVSIGAFGGPAFSHGLMILFQSPKLYGALLLWGICIYLLYQERFGKSAPFATNRSPVFAKESTE